MKFKNLFSGILFAVGMSVVIGTCLNEPQADTYGDWSYIYNEYADLLYINGYIGNETEVVIPSKLGDHSVNYVQINIGSDESNENLKKVKKVTFESGHKDIYNLALRGFENVEEVVISESVSDIKHDAFVNLKSLKKVEFPSSLKTIGNTAFKNCSSLESITIPEGLEKIEWGAFNNCKGLKSVTLPDSLKELDEDVFNGCLGLKDENGLVSVKGHLYHMDIASGVTEVTIPDGIKFLDGTLFSRNEDLKKVIIPDGVYAVGSGTFTKCSNLEEVVLPSTVKYIGDSAFSECVSLKKINVSGDIEFGANPFRGCKMLQDDKGYIVINGMLCAYAGTETDITIPDGVKKIGYAALSKTNITSVKMPDSLLSIENKAFLNCADLKKVEMSDSVTELGDSVFAECSSLSEVRLSPNIKDIKFDTFRDTPNLKEISIPEGVEVIKAFAFSDSGLETITLPASIKEIYSPGFKDNTKIIYKGSREQWAQIKSDSSVKDMTDRVFPPVTPTVVNTNTPTPQPATATPVPEVSGKAQATQTVTPVPNTTAAVTSAPATSSVPTADPTVSAAEPTAAVPPEVTSAPASDIFKFKGNSYKIKGKEVTLVKGAKKAKVSIPATVKYLGKKYKVTAIGASAFKSNKKLKAVTIGKNVNVIGKNAFYGDSKLSSVTIKSKLLKASKVGKNAFKGVNKAVVFKVPAAKKKLYSKIIAKSAKKYTIS